MKSTWAPPVAALLLVAASVPYIIASSRWFTTTGFIPQDLGGGTVWPWLGVILLAPLWSPLLIGAICASLRKGFELAFAAAMTPPVLTIVSRPWGWGDVGLGLLLSSSSPLIYGLLMSLHFILMAGAATLLLFSRGEFRDRETTSERLYAPPSKWRDMIT